MLQYLLKSINFSGLLKFVSPEFFRVVPPKMVFGLASELKRNHSDTQSWQQLCSLLENNLKKMDIAVQTQGIPSKTKADPQDSTQGNLVLELYFYQLLTRESWILDFRSVAFHQGPKGQLIWAPKPLYMKVDPVFLEAVRSMYIGFYEQNDLLFDQALDKLGLIKAKQSLQEHFGEGDQSSVKFRLTRFQQTFSDVFTVCARERIALHKDFAVLGLMLMGLYELLEGMEVAFDVRRAFESARSRALLK